MRNHKESLFNDREKTIKILLINPFGIGDILFSTPLIGILKRNLPNASLYYICNKRTYDVIEKTPGLDGIFIFEKDDYRKLWKRDKFLCVKELLSFVKRIKKERFDLAIDMSMGHQYSFFLKLINVPERVGFNYKGRGRFQTRRLEFDGFNDKPIGEYYKDLLRLIELDLYDEPTKIWLTQGDRDHVDAFFEKEGLDKAEIVVGLTPGGGVSFGKERIAFKRWPARKFAELADMLIREMNAAALLFWGPGEEDLIEEIKGLMHAGPIVAPKTSIRESAALMSRCSCVVCNDGGPLHVAVAAGARTISVFGPSDENVYGAYLKDNKHISVTRDIDCRPCYIKFKLPDCKTLDCLKGLDARRVFLEIERLIKEIRVDART